MSVRVLILTFERNVESGVFFGIVPKWFEPGVIQTTFSHRCTSCLHFDQKCPGPKGFQVACHEWARRASRLHRHNRIQAFIRILPRYQEDRVAFALGAFPDCEYVVEQHPGDMWEGMGL